MQFICQCHHHHHHLNTLLGVKRVGLFMITKLLQLAASSVSANANVALSKLLFPRPASNLRAAPLMKRLRPCMFNSEGLWGDTGQRCQVTMRESLLGGQYRGLLDVSPLCNGLAMPFICHLHPLYRRHDSASEGIGIGRA